MFMRFIRRGLAVAALALAFTLPLSGLSDRAEAADCLPGSIKSTLHQIKKKFGPVSIVSAYRPGAKIKGSGRPSLHAACRAVDFHPPKGKYKQVLSYLKSNHGGGLGTYSCGMYHLHIDNGPYVRFHRCQSALKIEKAPAFAVAKAGKKGKAAGATTLAKAQPSKPAAGQALATAAGAKPKELVSFVKFAMAQ